MDDVRDGEIHHQSGDRRLIAPGENVNDCHEIENDRSEKDQGADGNEGTA